MEKCLTGAAIRAGPALQARLVAVVVTVKVAEEVVSRPAEFVAAEAVVVVVAADADLVLELGHDAVVLQSLPLSARVDHPRLHGPLDHLTAATWEREKARRGNLSNIENVIVKEGGVASVVAVHPSERGVASAQLEANLKCWHDKP